MTPELAEEIAQAMDAFVDARAREPVDNRGPFPSLSYFLSLRQETRAALVEALMKIGEK
jgi:hypothetical protein